MGHFVLAFSGFLCYLIGMNDSVRLFSKVKADMVFLRETIAHDSDPIVVEIAKDALAKNQAWLDEWNLQNKVAMLGNVKK